MLGEDVIFDLRDEAIQRLTSHGRGAPARVAPGRQDPILGGPRQGQKVGRRMESEVSYDDQSRLCFERPRAHNRSR